MALINTCPRSNPVDPLLRPCKLTRSHLPPPQQEAACLPPGLHARPRFSVWSALVLHGFLMAFVFCRVRAATPALCAWLAG